MFAAAAGHIGVSRKSHSVHRREGQGEDAPTTLAQLRSSGQGVKNGEGEQLPACFTLLDTKGNESIDAKLHVSKIKRDKSSHITHESSEVSKLRIELEFHSFSYSYRLTF